MKCPYCGHDDDRVLDSREVNEGRAIRRRRACRSCERRYTTYEQIEDLAKLAWRLKVQNPLAISTDTEAHGLLWMDPAVWDANMAFYKEYGQIPRVVPAGEVMTNAFNPGIKSP